MAISLDTGQIKQGQIGKQINWFNSNLDRDHTATHIYRSHCLSQLAPISEISEVLNLFIIRT